MSARLAPTSKEIDFKTETVLDNLSGSFASQSFCGDSVTLAPFAPPRKSDVLKVFALSQAIETLSEIESPELKILVF